MLAGEASALELPSSIWKRIIKACKPSGRHPPPSTADTLSPCHDSSLLFPGQLASLTSQLGSFITAIGTGLAGVTSLDLTLNLGSHCCSASNSHTLAEAAGHSMASMLARACPHLHHICVSGGVVESALIALGSGCPLLTSLHLMDDDMPAVMLRTLMRLRQLPHITHITMDLSLPDMELLSQEKADRSSALMGAVCACETLTHLHAGEQHLQDPRDWLNLPQSLRDLRCYELPDEGLPHNLVMANLERVEVKESADGFGASQLLGLLRAAPNLRSLSVVPNLKFPLPTKECCLHLEPCGLDAVMGFQLLHQRVEAGLKLDHIQLTSRTCCEKLIGHDLPLIPLRELLSKLDPLPGFTYCLLHNEEVYPPGGDGDVAAASLSEVGRVLPNVLLLELSGVWHESDVQQLMVGPSLRLLSWSGLKNIKKASMVQLLARMPWLWGLSHDARSVHTSTRELRAMLHAAHSSNDGAAGGMSSKHINRVDRWTVSPGLHKSVIETWHWCSEGTCTCECVKAAHPKSWWFRVRRFSLR